jgi:hypothetical protein
MGFASIPLPTDVRVDLYFARELGTLSEVIASIPTRAERIRFFRGVVARAAKEGNAIVLEEARSIAGGTLLNGKEAV